MQTGAIVRSQLASETPRDLLPRAKLRHAVPDLGVQFMFKGREINSGQGTVLSNRSARYDELMNALGRRPPCNYRRLIELHENVFRNRRVVENHEVGGSARSDP